jgi:hypothetical protein
MINDISGTMLSSQNENKKVHYIVCKIGDKVYSTTFGEIPSKDVSVAKKQKTHTENIGEEDNLWLKGFFTEERGHNKLPVPVPFEINIYTEPKKSSQIKRNLKGDVILDF